MSEQVKKITLPFDAQEIQLLDGFLEDANMTRQQFILLLVSNVIGEINNLDANEAFLREKGATVTASPELSGFLDLLLKLRIKKDHPWPIQFNIKTKEK